MKEAIVDPSTSVKIIDSPVPVPGPGEVLIKVIVSGTNPKDWKLPFWTQKENNTGDDIAGIVTDFGEGVTGLHKGDKVAAFHVMMIPYGSFAEYAIAPQYLVFPIPEAISFEEAATVPLAAYTAAVALFYQLEYPSPWDKAAKLAAEKGTKRPLVVYGASTSVGAYAIKLAKFAGIHPIIAVGSKTSEFILPFLDESKGDSLVDYTAYEKQEDLAAAIKEAIKKGGIEDGRAYDVLDGVSTTQTVKLVTSAVAGSPDSSGRRPRVTTVLPDVEQEADPSVEIARTMVGQVHGDTEEEKLFGLIWGRVFTRGLAEGWFTPHPHEVAKGGLGGLEGALKGLREGTVRAKKMVIRIGETEGVEA